METPIRSDDDIDRPYAILIVLKNILPSIPSTHDMIVRSRRLNPWLSRHVGNKGKEPSTMEITELK